MTPNEAIEKKVWGIRHEDGTYFRGPNEDWGPWRSKATTMTLKEAARAVGEWGDLDGPGIYSIVRIS